MKAIRFVILLPFLIGAGALAALLMEKTDTSLAWILSLLGTRSALFLAIGAGLVLGGASLLKRGSRRGQYVRPQIVGARVGDGVGELTVSAAHSRDVSELSLPLGSKVSTIEPGSLYRVDLPTDRRSTVEAIAREAGYRGRVG